jgi:hypothetical protein
VDHELLSKVDGSEAITGPGGELVPRVIKVEANLLRLPLFALHTKGLRTLDAIECRGRLTRDGVAHEFTFRSFRSTATAYPGPLARSAHLAFLSLLTERGFPLQNPLTWSWRDLCRRMDISCSGRTVERLKAAIHSTAGLYILSTYALYSKPDNKRICTREDGLRLYERVSFLGSELPGGGVADTNHLWLSDWYLANLNALFTAPLDYDLWRRLEQRSPIASRLYEFLLINFYSGVPVLRINYENLVQFLPIKPERHPSQAKQQLALALKLLIDLDVLDEANWAESRDGLAQLHFHRGRHLTPPPDRGGTPLPGFEEFTSAVEVEELRSLKPPEHQIVAEFYRLWAGQESYRPTRKELLQARALLEQFGPAKLRALMQLVVKRMKVRWPEAKTFGGVEKYVPEIAEEYDRDQKRIERERREQSRRQKQREDEEKQEAHQAEFEAAWLPVWETLDPSEQEEIRRLVVGANPFFERTPRLARSLCLEELARRRGQARLPKLQPAGS